MNSKVAVILRTKNRPHLLRRALGSICAQSLRDWHLVIVNDGGSPAAISEVLREFDPIIGPRKTILHHATSMGMENSSNHGIQESQSQFIALHDDDDTWDPAFLEKTTDYLEENREFGGVITQWWKIIENDIGEKLLDKAPILSGPKAHELGLYYLGTPMRNFPPISFVYRRRVYETVGPYREDYQPVADWEFNLRFLTHTDIGMVEQPLARYHERPHTTDANLGNTISHQRDLHAKRLTKVRGEYLREDLRQGRHGLGSIISAACENYRIEQSLLTVVRRAMKSFAEPRPASESSPSRPLPHNA